MIPNRTNINPWLKKYNWSNSCCGSFLEGCRFVILKSMLILNAQYSLMSCQALNTGHQYPNLSVIINSDGLICSRMLLLTENDDTFHTEDMICDLCYSAYQVWSVKKTSFYVVTKHTEWVKPCILNPILLLSHHASWCSPGFIINHERTQPIC